MIVRQAVQPIARHGLRLSYPLRIVAVLGVLALGCAVATIRHNVPEARKITAATTAPAPPDDPGLLRMAVDGSSDVRLQGTTSIGAWLSKSRDVDAKVVVDMDRSTLNHIFDDVSADYLPELPALPIAVSSPAVVKLVVPVKSFKGGSKGMDHDMQAALKASEHPDIKYILDSVQSVSLAMDSKSERPALEIMTHGRLSVAGVEKQTSIDALVFRDPQGRIVVHAAKQLLMSDFDVKPPTALFGLIRAHNAMIVDFDLDFVPARP